MIYLGYTEEEKQEVVERYMAGHGISHVIVISPKQRPLEFEWADNVEWAETIMYRTFYRLLQEIDDDTLIVLSEPLRTQNRYDLTYNCIRNFLNQTRHQLIFQHLPQIDGRDDFMILFDFDTQSRWKRSGWDINLILDNCQVDVRPLPIVLNRIDVPTSRATKKRYAKDRARRFEKLGNRDPHTIPRNLYLLGGKDKLAYIDAAASQQLPLFGSSGQGNCYVARNQRLNRDNIITYGSIDDTAVSGPVALVEFPHRFIDFADFLHTTGQTRLDVLTADLKVDDWYYERYTKWVDRINETYASLQE